MESAHALVRKMIDHMKNGGFICGFTQGTGNINPLSQECIII